MKLIILLALLASCGDKPVIATVAPTNCYPHDIKFIGERYCQRGNYCYREKKLRHSRKVLTTTETCQLVRQYKYWVETGADYNRRPYARY